MPMWVCENAGGEGHLLSLKHLTGRGLGKGTVIKINEPHMGFTFKKQSFAKISVLFNSLAVLSE